MGFGRDGQDELMSFTALGSPSKKQTCMSMIVGNTHHQDRVSPGEAAPALPCSHRGQIPAGWIPASPNPGPRRITAIPR